MSVKLPIDERSGFQRRKDQGFLRKGQHICIGLSWAVGDYLYDRRCAWKLRFLAVYFSRGPRSKFGSGASEYAEGVQLACSYESLDSNPKVVFGSAWEARWACRSSCRVGYRHRPRSPPVVPRWVARTATTYPVACCCWRWAASNVDVGSDWSPPSGIFSASSASRTRDTPCKRCPVMSVHT